MFYCALFFSNIRKLYLICLLKILIKGFYWKGPILLKQIIWKQLRMCINQMKRNYICKKERINKAKVTNCDIHLLLQHFWESIAILSLNIIHTCTHLHVIQRQVLTCLSRVFDRLSLRSHLLSKNLEIPPFSYF